MQQLIDYAKPYYNVPGRYYHTWDHIDELLNNSPLPLTVEQQIAIIFHDIVYIPGSPSGISESLSYDLLAHVSSEHDIIFDSDVMIINDIIVDTISHMPSRRSLISQKYIILICAIHCGKKRLGKI